MTRWLLAACAAAPFAWVCGCAPAGPAPPPTAPVSGTAVMDGKPLPAGELHFTANGLPPRMFEVKDGGFTGEAAVGEYQVELVIHGDGSPSEKYKGVREKVNVAPQKYWGTKTALSATVEAGKPNAFTFDMRSR